MALYCASVSVPLGMSCWRNVGEPVVNTGHTGTPVPFGLPVFAKFVHAATNWSDRTLSVAIRVVGHWPGPLNPASQTVLATLSYAQLQSPPHPQF